MSACTECANWRENPEQCYDCSQNKVNRFRPMGSVGFVRDAGKPLNPKMPIRVRVVKSKELLSEEGRMGFGAWCDGSLKAEDGTILLDIEACLDDLVQEDGTPVPMNRARVIAETLMHEFGHALEDALGLKYDEDYIEDTTSKFFK